MESAPVLIAGGGPCGLMCALVLQRQGVPCVVLERVAADKLTADVGSGFELMPTSVRILQRLDLPWKESMTTYGGFGFYSANGTHLRDASILGAEGLDVWSAQRGGLQRLLKDALGSAADIRCGAGISKYSETDSGVKVEMTDGSSLEGRALLACDGWKSVVRAQMLPNDPINFCNVIVYWGMSKLTPEAKLLVDETQKAPHGKSFIWIMGTYSEPGVFAGSSTGEEDFMWSFGIPSTKEPSSSTDLQIRGGIRGETVKEELMALLRGRCDLVKSLVACSPPERVTKVGLYDRQNLDQPFVSPGGRVALLGDAAHPQTPALGQGLNMALADAFATCTRLAKQDTRTALRALDSPERKAFAKKVVLDARSAEELLVTDNCFKLALSHLMVRYAPVGMLLGDGKMADDGNWDFVDLALKECDLPL